MEKKAPIRRCTGCGERKDKKDLIRIVRTVNENEEVSFRLDRTGKLQGRGAYLCDNRACFDAAVKRKGLERSFHASIPAKVYETLEKEFETKSP